MNVLLNILWFIWEIKYILFWVYLWQLKEYHFGRFADHFNTFLGKKLLVDIGQVAKLILLGLLFFVPSLESFFVALLFLVYVPEVILFLVSLYKRTFKKPVPTSKAVFLTGVLFLLLFYFITLLVNVSESNQAVFLILFDIATPVIVSLIVLMFQPLAVIIRNNTIVRAKQKLETIRNKSGLKVIAITGSYGKTSTKEFLGTILESKYQVLRTSKHQNSEIGIANEIIKNLTQEHQFFIAEVGAYNKGKVKEVCSFIKPSIGVVTGVNEQHLSLFGSMDNLLLAEGGVELEEALPDDGLLVVNGENKYCLSLYKRSEKNKRIYAQSNKKIDADIFADDITASRSGISFIGMDKSGNANHFSANVLGKHNVCNLLAAITVAHELGMTYDEISLACRRIIPEQGGMMLQAGIHGIEIINSSYSANPDGVYADLDYLSLFNGKKIVIMPSLIELGKKSSQVHYKIGRKIADICDLAIITTPDQYESIRNGATDNGMASKNIVLCEKPIDIVNRVTLFSTSNDAVLLEGRVPSAIIKLLAK